MTEGGNVPDAGKVEGAVVGSVVEPAHPVGESLAAPAHAQATTTITTTTQTKPVEMAAAERSEAATVSQGQRRVNLIWEITQFVIAVSVVEALLWVAVSLALKGDDVAITGLFGLGNLVIGFYFGRTNHQRTGGVLGTGQDGR